jgi:hypothetical protein
MFNKVREFLFLAEELFFTFQEGICSMQLFQKDKRAETVMLLTK